MTTSVDGLRMALKAMLDHYGPPLSAVEYPAGHPITLAREALATRTPAPSLGEDVVEALRKCRDKFREYERMHLAKVKPVLPGQHWAAAANEEAEAKADRNREMADMCDAALSAMRPVQEEEAQP